MARRWHSRAGTHPGSQPLLLPVVARQVPVQLLVDPATAVLVREEVRQWRRRPAVKTVVLNSKMNHNRFPSAKQRMVATDSWLLLSPARGHAKRDVGHLSALGTLPPAGLGDVVLVHKHGPLGAVLTQLFGRDHAGLDRVPVQGHDVGRRRRIERRQDAVGVPTGQNCPRERTAFWS